MFTPTGRTSFARRGAQGRRWIWCQVSVASYVPCYRLTYHLKSPNPPRTWYISYLRLCADTRQATGPLSQVLAEHLLDAGFGGTAISRPSSLRTSSAVKVCDYAGEAALINLGAIDVEAFNPAAAAHQSGRRRGCQPHHCRTSAETASNPNVADLRLRDDWGPRRVDSHRDGAVVRLRHRELPGMSLGSRTLTVVGKSLDELKREGQSTPVGRGHSARAERRIVFSRHRHVMLAVMALQDERNRYGVDMRDGYNEIVSVQEVLTAHLRCPSSGLQTE